MKIFVLNGETALGDDIIQTLHRSTHESKKGIQLSTNVSNLAHSGNLWTLGVDLIESTDVETLVCQLQNTDYVIIVPDLSSSGMADQVENCVEAAKMTKQPPKLIFLSQLGIENANLGFAKSMLAMEQSVLGTETASLGFVKSMLAMERCVLDSNLKNVIVRSGFWMQNLFTFAPSIRKHHSLQWPFPSTTDTCLTLVNLCDIVGFIQDLVTRGFKENTIYNLTGTQMYTPDTLCECMSDVVGTTIKYEPCTKEECMSYLRSLGLNETYVGRMMVILQSLYQDILEMIEKGIIKVKTDDHKKQTGREATSVDEWLKIVSHHFQ